MNANLLFPNCLCNHFRPHSILGGHLGYFLFFLLEGGGKGGGVRTGGPGGGRAGRGGGLIFAIRSQVFSFVVSIAGIQGYSAILF